MKNILSSLVIIILFSCNQSYEPVNPIPSNRQKIWQEMEYYAFIHFNMNTFTNMEWGFGDESPSTFNPTELDTDQWARIIKESGMKGIIITAKHHDGFSLWPSKYSEHSVKNSPWNKGKGDLIKDLENSCKKYDLKLGIYLSPWDRNHPDYGKESYIKYFRNQLTELLTNYGEIFEVWFDGANGGSGYYGGANDVRKVDKKTYYDWDNTHKLIRKYQPNAVIFSDAGPDIRWVGNEKGYASKTTWSNIYRDSLYGGMPDYYKFSSGQEFGTHFIPTETDVSIRPGWYYHPEEDNKVKSLDKLIDIYFNSIGLNSSLLLNIPVDKRGLIHENDALRMLELNKFLKNTFNKNLIEKSEINFNNKSHPINKIIDKNINTFCPFKSKNNNIINITLKNEKIVDVFEISENINLGQRIKEFVFEIKVNEKWVTVEKGTTVGKKRLIKFEPLIVKDLRFTIFDSKDIPLISEIGLYKSPELK
ncbi:alpha-L-fucosidase [Flavobacteriaceae bacterium]|nr:alpha-L-fucosidase [Flavobacteriaceae bacterium]MDB4014372.1 alpha-L-fucosidase [Flavobacteriaceae bacterium]